jgi:predicted dehydrogenase
VLIAAPPHLHAEMTAACIRHGLPAFVEKPLTLSVQEARTLVELAERQQPIVFVDHINLFNPAFRALRDAVRGRAPLEIETEAGATPEQPIHDYSVLWDWGSHDVAMALTLTEGRMPASAAARRISIRPDGRETVEFALWFDDGTHSRHIVGNLWDRRRRSLLVRHRDEEWRFDDLASKKFARIAGAHIEFPDIPIDPPLTVALREFARAVQMRKPDYEQLLLGARVVEVLDMCDNAMRASS